MTTETFAGGFLMEALRLFLHTHASHADALENLARLFVEKERREAYRVMAEQPSKTAKAPTWVVLS